MIAIGFALALFKVGPALLTSWLPIDGTYSFVIVEGLIRVAVLIGYIVLIGLLPDLKRVFEYHGAEHKAINALEGGSELTPEKVQKFSLIHPRCGTAFLLWVMVIGVFVFALVGRPVWYWLIISRILLLPVIAGLAYELIRYAGKHQGNRVLMTLLAPGLWLQRLTTREPSLDQIEVSIRALQEVMRVEQAESEGELRAGVPRRGHGVGRGPARASPTSTPSRKEDRCRESFVKPPSTGREISPAVRARSRAASSGAFVDLPFSIASRIAAAPDKTSPEELLAAAHGGCFTTSLAGELTKAGTPPEQPRRALHDHDGRGRRARATRSSIRRSWRTARCRTATRQRSRRRPRRPTRAVPSRR